MKKVLLNVSIASVALLLWGCGTNNNNSSQDTSSKTKTEKKEPKKSSSKKAVHKSSTVSSSSSANAASSASSANQGQQDKSSESRIETLNSALNRSLGHVLLPQRDGLGEGSANLNARYTGNSANYTVYYSVGNSPKPLNDPSVQNEVPYATLYKKTYDSASAAQGGINYHPASEDQGLPSVDLGHNITGHINAGAGQRYLHWNEGRWSLAVHAAAVNGEDPAPTAKTIVNLLETHSLPVPNTIAAGEFEVSGTNKLTWQDGNTVYSIQGKSAETIIKMAESMK